MNELERLGAFAKDGEVGAVGIESAVFAAGGFLDEPCGGKGDEDLLDGMEGEPCGGGCGWRGSNRMGLEVGEQAQGGAGGAAEGGNEFFVLPEKGEQAAGGLNSSPGDFVDTLEEKGQPCLPVAILAHGLRSS